MEIPHVLCLLRVPYVTQVQVQGKHYLRNTPHLVLGLPQLFASVNYTTPLPLMTITIMPLNPRRLVLYDTPTPWCYAQLLTLVHALWKGYYPLTKTLLLMV